MLGGGFSGRNVLYSSHVNSPAQLVKGHRISGFRAVLQNSSLGKEIKIARKNNFLYCPFQETYVYGDDVPVVQTQALRLAKGTLVKRKPAGRGIHGVRPSATKPVVALHIQDGIRAFQAVKSTDTDIITKLWDSINRNKRP